MKLPCIIYPLIALISSMTLSSCAMYPYDPDNPDLYTDYWCDPLNRSDSVATVVNGRNNEDITGMSKQECTERYQMQKP